MHVWRLDKFGLYAYALNSCMCVLLGVLMCVKVCFKYSFELRM